jgi:hypothetical protein
MINQNEKEERTSEIEQNSYSDPKTIMVINVIAVNVFGRFIKKIKNIDKQ